MSRRVLLRLLFWGSVCLASSAGLAKSKIDIRPGPLTMSEEEKAIVADPARGVEHGVVLLVQHERNENLGTDTKYRFHLRAKILSTEARSLGDIEIRHDTNQGDLHEWWGRTILPDGTVHELKREQLHEQVVADVGGRRVVHLKGALPGIVPGCVIDWGYVYQGSGALIAEERVALQRSWPIRQLHYRWEPYRFRAGSCRLKNTKGFAITATRERRSFLVAGSDIPAFVEEPWMPPKGEAQPLVIFYYLDPSKDPKRFWSDEARKLETQATEFFGKDEKPLREAVASMDIPATADLETKLRTAYDWILDNIRNLTLRSREEMDEETKAGKPADRERVELKRAADVLRRREGWGKQVNLLFMGLARLLGAEARLVAVPNRTVHYWDPRQLDADQFEGHFIVVCDRGQPYEECAIVDPGGGLPWGELPWWLSGTTGLLAADGGGLSLPVPEAPAHRNTVEVTATIRFEDEQAAKVQWTRRASGQSAYWDRRQMRTMDAEQRQKRIEQLCGAGPNLEISRAEASGLEDMRQPLDLTCEATMPIVGISERIGSYRFSIDGPWKGAIPEFNSTERRHPIVFDFPRTEKTILDVAAPDGFVKAKPPPSVRLDANAAGSYILSILPTPNGYRVERTFTLLPLGVAAESYDTLRQFLNDARHADRTQFAFKSSSGP